MTVEELIKAIKDEDLESLKRIEKTIKKEKKNEPR